MAMQNPSKYQCLQPLHLNMFFLSSVLLPPDMSEKGRLSDTPIIFDTMRYVTVWNHLLILFINLKQKLGILWIL